MNNLIQSFKIILFLKLHNKLTAFYIKYLVSEHQKPPRIHFLQPGRKIIIPFKNSVK